MHIELIWGLQQLKNRLRGAEKEEFLQLESDFLDLLHRQRLYNNSEELEIKRDEIIQRFEVLSQNSVHKNFTALCIVPPTNRLISGSPNTTEPFFPPLADTKTPGLLPFCPNIEIQLLTKVVPIAYCYRYNEQEYPLITLHVNNTQKQSTDIAFNAKAYFEGYGNTDTRHIEVPAGRERDVVMLPVIGKEEMKAVNEPCPATLHIEIQYLLPSSFLIPQTYRIQFLPRNAAILWQYEDDGSLSDYTSCLAAWVTPHHIEIRKLLRDATEYHPEKRITGYSEVGISKEQPQKIREQVQAIFDVLHHKLQLRYVSSPGMIQSQEDHVIQRIQRVHLPAEVIEVGSFNCIDGTVLFASLLELANLQPLIFLRPGHAFVGWRVFKDEPVYEFLETTLIDKGDFNLALLKGQEQYEQALKYGTLGRTVNDLHDFACLIDIADCRSKNIRPMDW